MSANNEPGGGWDHEREIQRLSPTPVAPEPLPVVDSSHDCESCRAQSSKFYEVGGRCLNCGQKYRVKVRNGDDPPLSVDCPRCESSGYSWRTTGATGD